MNCDQNNQKNNQNQQNQKNNQNQQKQVFHPALLLLVPRFDLYPSLLLQSLDNN